MARDRLDQYIKDQKFVVSAMKENPIVARFVEAQGALKAAKKMRKMILAEEEEVNEIIAPKESLTVRTVQEEERETFSLAVSD